MKCLVLGAGVIGTSTAYFLAKDGHDVTVLDRQPGAALETSFGNGGVLHTSECEPWSRPGMTRNILKWLGKEGRATAGALSRHPQNVALGPGICAQLQS